VFLTLKWFINRLNFFENYIYLEIFYINLDILIYFLNKKFENFSDIKKIIYFKEYSFKSSSWGGGCGSYYLVYTHLGYYKLYKIKQDHFGCMGG